MANEQYRVADVLVVGAGISGIQAALDLAECDFRVCLTDAAPAIGGHMAQLDKTFPTLDCSMCIESPKFIEVDRHPNIEIITLTELNKVDGEAGNFEVTLLKKARYIDEDLCRGCGTCAQYCPVKIPDRYNENLSPTKSSHKYFPQAVPSTSYIDPDSCLFLKDKKCSICQAVCENRAIDFHQQDEIVKVHVGAIILAPGFDAFDPKLRSDYGYSKYKNVITSLEFERLSSASGPHQGELLRPSDGKHPEKIAWIQCVGSRQVIPGGNSYCSAVCCMYATKQVILAKDYDERIEATIFNNDVRTAGKEFEQFYQRARALPGVRYIRSYVSIGREIPENKNVTIRYSVDSEAVKEEEFNLVVLSVGLNPPKGAKELAEKLGIKLNQHGFCQTDFSNPLETSKPGIFVSGAFQGPMDIPDAVVTGSAAAAMCGQMLVQKRGKLAREKEYPAEENVAEKEARVGVFVCHCGTNIAGVINTRELAEYAAKLPNVVHAEENLFSCSADTARQISDRIKEKKLNRVIVAACTPRTHEPLFQDTLRQAGINKYLFDLSNIREHCSWVHARERTAAAQKARDVIRMSLARVLNLRPLDELKIPVNKRALVVGGGIAGMTSALSLAQQGFGVYLVEKEDVLGGVARRIKYSLEGADVQSLLSGIIEQVYQNPRIHIFSGATVAETSGYIGNMISKIKSSRGVDEINHGVAIIATGAEEYRPTEYLYGKDDRVVTLLELEERLAVGDPKILNARSLVMVQCVGCRDASRPHCSKVCCAQAIKCALKLKEKNPQQDVYIMFRDMMTYGFKEDYYREAANQGVQFIHYDPDNKPEVEIVKEGGQNLLRVSVVEPVLGKKLAIDADILALAAAVIPPASNAGISKLFKVPLSRDGFFLEAHAKLRPVDFAVDGVFLCGTANYPKPIDETVRQALAAAGRAATVLSKDTTVSSGAISEVDEARCLGCGSCQTVCPFGAIELSETGQGTKAGVIALLCKGCGICNTRCPTGAITVNHFTDGQVISQIKALSEV